MFDKMRLRHVVVSQILGPMSVLFFEFIKIESCVR